MGAVFALFGLAIIILLGLAAMVGLPLLILGIVFTRLNARLGKALTLPVVALAFGALFMLPALLLFVAMPLKGLITDAFGGGLSYMIPALNALLPI